MPKRTATEPKSRKPDEIMAEYGQACALLGDLTYKLEIGIPKTLAELKARLEALNAEHAAALAAQSKETPSNG